MNLSGIIEPGPFSLTDDTQATKTAYSYSPYGETQTTGEASDQPYQFTGREDDGTGLYYYRARYYDPEGKRFLSSDPIGLKGGLNSYAYANLNPLRFTDPLGLDAADKVKDRIDDIKRLIDDPEYNECVANCQKAKTLICGFISMGATGIGYTVGGIAGIPLAPVSGGTSVVAGAEIGGAALGTGAALACSLGTQSCLDRCKKKQCK